MRFGKKQFSLILPALFAVFFTLFTAGCMSTADEAYQSPWVTPNYDPYTYNPATAEKTGNFPVFNKGAPQTPIPPQTQPAVEQQTLPDLKTVSSSAPIAGQYPTPAREPEYVGINPADSASVKVGVLLPLSGKSADVGKAILNAMQLALFDIADSKVAMIVKDTQGTPEGAKAAAREVIAGGAKVILGPLFSSEAKTVAPIAAENGVNILTFSTDWSAAGNNVYVMGFMPFTQVSRVTEYAAIQGRKNFAAFTPKSGYGAAVVNTLQQTLSAIGLPEANVARFAPADNETVLTPQLRDFTKFESRIDNLNRRKAELINAGTPDAAAELNDLSTRKTIGSPGYDAVLLPVGGKSLGDITKLLAYFELDRNTVKLLGTGLWDDETLYANPMLQGAWFAAPDPAARISFERNYMNTYSSTPPRIATLGYDSMALVAVLSYKGIKARGTPFFEREYLTDPNGFAGIDGVFRFRADGLIERQLAVLEIRNGTAVIVDPAPRSFLNR